MPHFSVKCARGCARDETKMLFFLFLARGGGCCRFMKGSEDGGLCIMCRGVERQVRRPGKDVRKALFVQTLEIVPFKKRKGHNKINRGA